MPTPVASVEGVKPGERQLLSKQIVGLDGLRLLAACLVLAFHLLFAIWIPGANRRVPHTALFDPLQPFVTFGWVGVEIFFVISGFVIAYSAHGVGAITFVRHRWLRLFPAAVLCATVSGVALLYLHEIPLHSVVFAWGRSVLFYPKGGYVDGAYWTLSIEIAFYFVVFLLQMMRRERWLPRVMAVLGCTSAFYWVLDAAKAHLPSTLDRLYLALHSVASWNISLLPHGCYFALGVFLWLLCLDGVTVARVCVASACFVGGVLQIEQRTGLMQTVLHAPQSRVAPVVLWVGAVAVVIVSARWNHAIQETLGVRGIAVFRRLGLMTYPLYLLNQTLGRALVLALFPSAGYVVATAVSVAVIVALTFVVASYLEPPLRRWMGRGIDRFLGEAQVSGLRTAE